MKEERSRRESRPARPGRNGRSAARRGRPSRGGKPAKKSALLAVSWIFLGAVLVLGCVWMLGLGLIAWPRFSMMRLYYHRIVMRDTEVM